LPPDQLERRQWMKWFEHVLVGLAILMLVLLVVVVKTMN
jgi:hypothetical protein